MINVKNITKFCKEEISKIENYEKAINDVKQTWVCHHRKETDDGLSVKQLQELGLYYGRPANELIFLTKTEHNRLHNSGKSKSEKTKQRLSESHKGKNKGEKNGMYGKPSNIRGKHIVWDDKVNNKYHFEF